MHGGQDLLLKENKMEQFIQRTENTSNNNHQQKKKRGDFSHQDREKKLLFKEQSINPVLAKGQNAPS